MYKLGPGREKYKTSLAHRLEVPRPLQNFFRAIEREIVFVSTIYVPSALVLQQIHIVRIVLHRTDIRLDLEILAAGPL